MKIVNILGGLGNQMFQYAMAVALKSRFPDEAIKINTLCFRGYPLHNGYELNNIFNVQIANANVSDLSKVAWPWIHYRLWQIGRRMLPRRKSMVWDKDFPGEFLIDSVANKSYFDGYWQSPKFWGNYREDILKAFIFPQIEDSKNLEAIDFIHGGKTSFIHVRRGDYINHPIYGGICTSIYYDHAIAEMIEHGFNRFIIFSNDIAWCQRNISNKLQLEPALYVDWNKGKDSFRDIQLMSLCKGGIIANSSFSWWGAWLGKNNTVICPAVWCKIPGHRADIFPNNWTKINPE